MDEQHSVYVTFGITVGLKTQQKTYEGKKCVHELTDGDDLFRKTCTWNRLRREIDRKRDWYEETITDDKGNVLRDCREPLSVHVGRGSARFRDKKT